MQTMTASKADREILSHVGQFGPVFLNSGDWQHACNMPRLRRVLSLIKRGMLVETQHHGRSGYAGLPAT